MSSNELEDLRLEDLENFPRLESVDAGANRVVRITGLEVVPSLRTLSVPFNRLTDLHFLSGASIARLDARDNSIARLADLAALQRCSRLEDLRLQVAAAEAGVPARLGNPVCALPGYAAFVLSACPSLAMLDGLPVALWRGRVAADAVARALAEEQEGAAAAAASAWVPPPPPSPLQASADATWLQQQQQQQRRRQPQGQSEWSHEPAHAGGASLPGRSISVLPLPELPPYSPRAAAAASAPQSAAVGAAGVGEGAGTGESVATPLIDRAARRFLQVGDGGWGMGVCVCVKGPEGGSRHTLLLLLQETYSTRFLCDACYPPRSATAVRFLLLLPLLLLPLRPQLLQSQGKMRKRRPLFASQRSRGGSQG